MKMQQQRKSRAERSQPALVSARIATRFRFSFSLLLRFLFFGSFCKLPSEFSLNFPLQGSRKRTKRTETETETAMVVQNRIFPTMVRRAGGVKILEQGVSKHTAAANSQQFAEVLCAKAKRRRDLSGGATFVVVAAAHSSTTICTVILPRSSRPSPSRPLAVSIELKRMLFGE